MEKHLLAFVVDNEKQQVCLHVDKNGVDRLIQELKHIKSSIDENDCPHSHMFSSEWGDGELSISTQLDEDSNGNSIHHLKILGWTDEWVVKHGFECS